MAGGTDFQHRTSLPVPGHSEVNLCSVLSISKDLSKVTMPVVFNEPLSFLQRISEYMEYAKLLKLAAQQDCPIARLEYVTAFAVSALASNWDRLGKPFNPLLGETYELQRTDFRIVCEQVSHHPPISAFHADSEDFIFHGTIHPKLKFWGKSIQIHPKGVVTVELPKWKEAYTWHNVNCILHNVLVGQIWMEHLGVLEIKQIGGQNLRAELNFKSASSSSKELHRVEGFILDDRKRLAFLYGKWTECLKAAPLATYEEAVERVKREAKSPQGSPGHKKVLARLHSLKVGAFRQSTQETFDESSTNDSLEDLPAVEEVPGSTVLWEVTPRPPNAADYYQFTIFAMGLNELEPGMDGKLCPTDSRLRPDIRKLENGDQDGAAAEKNRLEEKQRDSSKMRKHKKANSEYNPRWFAKGINPQTGLEDWLYQGGYWESSYEDIEDIF